MPKINMLDKNVYQLIAAGEVVERPASLVKELLENSIDANSTHITLEIQNGGITYIRITDDGCGISHEDVPLAFKAHATSKIKSEEDLDSIGTLGFRGEALASVCAVSRVNMLTKPPEENFGTHYVIEGGNEILNEDSGCPNGTTIIIRDLFYNTPARMKFLKKDSIEANTISTIFESTALSHPEIAFKLIRDGKAVAQTPGDGSLNNAIYMLLGKEMASDLIPINYENTRVSVNGFITKPTACRQSRNRQYTFLNGRYVRSGTVMAAAEQAYKNSVMVGKFPAFFVNISIAFDFVDVNVHPAKTEIRFSDEKSIFEAVYNACKSGLVKNDTRPEIKPMANDSQDQHAPEISKEPFNNNDTAHTLNWNTPPSKRDIENIFEVKEPAPQLYINPFSSDYIPKKQQSISDKLVFHSDDVPSFYREIEQKTIPNLEINDIAYIGECFKTYIILQKGESIYLIDKHAAHERIIYNRMKSEKVSQSQALLLPIDIKISSEELAVIEENTSSLQNLGFEIESFGISSAVIRAIPAELIGCDVASVLYEIIENLKFGGIPTSEKFDRIYETIACKAAIKAGYTNGKNELLELGKKVLNDSELMYCPHGRPIAFEIKKHNLEKYFGRLG